jgi:hypothetical protein
MPLHHREALLAAGRFSGADVLELESRVSVRRVVVAEDRVVSLDGQTRYMARHQDDRVPRMTRRIGIGACQHERDLAVLLHAARGPGFAPVEHVFVAHTAGLELELGRIRTWHIGLGNADRGADAALQETRQIVLADRRRGELLDELGVPDRAGVAVESLGADRRRAHHLGDGRVIEQRQPMTADLPVEGEDPQSLRLGPGAELAKHWLPGPAVGRSPVLFVVGRLGRIHLRCMKRRTLRRLLASSL